VGHVGDVHPELIAIPRPLDGDRVVEVLGVRPVYGHRREVAEVPALAGVLARDRLGLLLRLAREGSGGRDGGEERLVDVAGVPGRPDHARHLAAQRAVLLTRADEDDVPGLGAATELAGDQHRAPLLDEERVGDRVLTPANQHGRQYQEGTPVLGRGTS
jgi:hypothetical protein